MNINELPFLHFMMIVQDGKDSWLLSPREAQGCGGVFVAPLGDNQQLLPCYRFHYSIYHDEVALSTGIAVSTSGGSDLFLIFGVSPPGPRLYQVDDQLLIPIFRCVPQRFPLRYHGRFHHRDFGSMFAELEPVEPTILDRVLDGCSISVVGCDPHTMYSNGTIA